MKANKNERLVVIGAGFAGLALVKNLKNKNISVTLIEKTNHHLFQPLLYQVATAALSPADISAPVRAILRKKGNVEIIFGEVTGIDKVNKLVKVRDQNVVFDYLVVATGTNHSYFGNDGWEQFAPGLKTLSDALKIRERMLQSFEEAENRAILTGIVKPVTFVVVGAGPTGVELAGAIAEISRKTLSRDFRKINPKHTRVILVEAGNRILSSYASPLNDKAQESVESLGVQVLLNTKVTKITNNGVYLDEDFIATTNVIWAAGNSAPSILKQLNSPLDNQGRVIVNKDCTIPGEENIFVLGDSAHFKDEKGNILPGVAQVAMQQGKYLARILNNSVRQPLRKPFKYLDLGNMATIGRAKAIMQTKNIKIAGFIAWVAWVFVHVLNLVSFRNKIKVMAEWIWFYLSFKSGARLITHNSDNVTGKSDEVSKVS
ncbi:MAG: NAD(P)/FAD-dependent oxidoreductase [Ignavibacteriaceae bacterium]|nr:NAD(P)/FAD-dependent oxidoreductase [Ignavibacteriaceae bacterium]